MLSGGGVGFEKKIDLIMIYIEALSLLSWCSQSWNRQKNQYSFETLFKKLGRTMVSMIKFNKCK